jgi:hypothetical protein
MQLALSKDLYGVPIQALALDASIKVLISGSSQREILPTLTELVRIAAPANCFIKLGDSTVVATSSDALMLAGVEIFRVPTGSTHIAVLQDTGATGYLSATKMI